MKDHITFFWYKTLKLSSFILLFVFSIPFGCKTTIFPFHSIDWKNGWEMRWIKSEEAVHFTPEQDQNSQIYTPYKIPYMSLDTSPNKYLLIRKKIEGISLLKDPSIFFRGGGQILCIYVENQKIAEQYSLKEIANTFGEKKYEIEFNTQFFPVVPLPRESEGKYIYILFYTYQNLPVGFSESPLVSNQTENYKALVNRNQILAGLGFFFLILGIFSSYLYLRRKKKAIIAFTIFSVLSGIHFMAQVGFWGYLWYESFELIFYTIVLTLFTIPIAALYFFDKLFGIGRRNIIRMLWQFYILFSFVILSLSFTQVVSFTFAFVTFTWVAFPSLVLQVIVAWNEFSSGKPRAWILVLGCLCLLFFNLHDVLSAMGLINSIVRISPWGFFLFVLSLSLYGEDIFRNSEVKYASLQKEIITASRIQNAILPPSPPTWDRLKISVYYQPSHEVGGDFYDFQALGENKYGVLIADVVGHGLGASIIASLSKFSFFQNNLHWRNPAFLLSSMNDDLVKRSNGRFTTASYFYFDFEKMKLVVASAGHPSFFHWSKRTNSISENKPKGKPLGILENLTFIEEDFTFQKGDQFLLYTDGLPEEIGNGKEEFGTPALLALFQRVASKNTVEALEELMQGFRESIGWNGLPHDDITLLYLEVT